MLSWSSKWDWTRNGTIPYLVFFFNSEILFWPGEVLQAELQPLEMNVPHRCSGQNQVLQSNWLLVASRFFCFKITSKYLHTLKIAGQPWRGHINKGPMRAIYGTCNGWHVTFWMARWNTVKHQKKWLRNIRSKGEKQQPHRGERHPNQCREVDHLRA